MLRKLSLNCKIVSSFNFPSIRHFGYYSDPPVLVTKDPSKVWYFQDKIDKSWNVNTDYLFDQKSINQTPPKVYSLEEYNSLHNSLWTYDSERPIFDINLYMSKCKSEKHGTNVIYAPVLSSTQGILNSRFPGISEGLVCLTGIQTSAVGRGKNVWNSPYGCLPYSYKSKLPNAAFLPQIQYLVSLCVIKTIKQFPKCKDLDIKIKWPNDIYANGKKKICGILCQSLFHSDSFDITTGIGLNISNSSPTTCIIDLMKERYPNDTDISFKPEEYLAAYFANFTEMNTIFKELGFKTFIKSYIENWLHTDQEVQILLGADKIDVKISGLTDDGFLLALDKNGKKHELLPDGNRFDYFQGLISKKIT